jgi:predicted dienelactone hydrolase
VRRLIALLLGVVILVALRHTARRHTRPAPAVQTAQVAPSAPCQTSVGYRVMHMGGRPVAVWYPTNAAPASVPYTRLFSGMAAKDAPVAVACGGPVPLIVFSHGDLGCGIQSMTLTEEIARHGYVVAAPDHADAAICHTEPPAAGAPTAASVQQPKIMEPQNWDASSRTDRRQDVEAVIDELLKNPEFSPTIDATKIGLAGHSLGGYTVVGMAGGWPSWTDTRVRAVLALSPYVMPFQIKNTLGNVHVPLMYQGGDIDVGITPFLAGPKGAYAAANAPVYFVVLRKASHLAWANCGREQTTEACLANVPDARLIADYSVAFFDHHLKGLPEPILGQPNAALAAYEFRP